MPVSAASFFFFGDGWNGLVALVFNLPYPYVPLFRRLTFSSNFPISINLPFLLTSLLLPFNSDNNNEIEVDGI